MNKPNNRLQTLLANPFPERYILLICIYITLAISIMDLAGWALGITVFKSIDDSWAPMMIDTAISFILCAMSIYILQKKITTGLISRIPKISGVLVFIMGAVTLCLHIAILNNVNEKSLMENPFLGIFLAPNNRMALVTACNFVLIGIIVFLISFHEKRLTGIAHSIVFPVILASYTIPVSYILNLPDLHAINNVSVALPTGIAFCTLCLGILFSDTKSWVMKVFTSPSPGGLMARRLLPGMILLPIVIAWLRIQGEKRGLFQSEVGVGLVAITYTVCFIILTWLSAKEANRIDKKREMAEGSLRETNDYLENLFSYANAPIIVWDTESKITRFNPAFESMTGRKAEEVIGQSIEILFPADLVASSMELIKKAQTGERLEIAEIKILHVDGSIKTVLWNSAPVLEADRKTITEIIAQGQDITERKRAEDSLRESNNYLENLFRYANAPIIVWNTESKITRFNPAFKSMTGRKAEEVIGQSIEILFPADLVTSSMELIKKTQTGERLEIEEINILNVNGSVRTVLWNSAPMFGADGKTITEIIAQGQDITTRKDVENSLRETNEYLENLFNYANAPIIVWDTEFKITRFNPAFELLTGRKAKEVIGRSIEILFPEDFVESSMEILKQAQKGERLVIAEIKILHVNGSVKTVIWNSAPVLGPDGKTIIEVIAQGQDISERLQAESDLQKLSGELEIIIDSIPGLVFYKDLNNRFIRVNKYMCDAYKMSKNQLEGIYLDKLHTKEEAAAYFQADQKVIQSRQPLLNIEEPWPTDNGLHWLNTSKVPYLDKTGEVIGIIGVSMDVTDRKLAEGELEIYRKHLEELVTERTAELATAVSNLEQSNKELEEFAYVASHDLQEPLRMVSSYTQLLERRYKNQLDQDANDFIEYAVDGANRMQRLINDLLEYSRVSSQGKEFVKVDISMALGHAISNLKNLISDNLALVTNDDLPVLNADETQIVRVFQNLIENAIKYKKKTELPKIHISCKKKNNLYEFSVSDNGMGIEMQYHDRVFVIFQRLHRKDDYPGTGIGLSVSKRIVERHGGTIWFESTKDEGTTFYFTIPIKT
jgi:PAS domain S-box-containing protein